MENMITSLLEQYDLAEGDDVSGQILYNTSAGCQIAINQDITGFAYNFRGFPGQILLCGISKVKPEKNRLVLVVESVM